MQQHNIKKTYQTEIEKDLQVKYGKESFETKLDDEYYIDLITDKFKEKTIERKKVFNFLRSDEVTTYLQFEQIVQLIEYIDKKRILFLI